MRAMRNVSRISISKTWREITTWEKTFEMEIECDNMDFHLA
jgi:hypothetical protein